MYRPDTWVPCSLVFALTFAASASAQAPQQFKADIRMSGGSLSAPATGVMYFGGSKIRMELSAEGQQITLIQDPASGSLLMIMPSERMYMEVAAGMAPVEAPRARPMDPANPCAGGQATACTSLGDENVNGYATRKWQYEVEGKMETAWIATQLRFPVRLLSADGTTTDYRNVTLGPQPASLFSPPSDYVRMDMGPVTVMGMGGGRGMPSGGGRGMPSGGGRGMASPIAGIPPEVLAMMDSATIAMMMSGSFDPAAVTPPGSAPGGTPWEQGDGWIVEVTVTASGTQSGTNGPRGGTWTSTYSAELEASVPLTYGTPGAGVIGAVGPAWQLLATMGSPKALATPLTFSATTQYRVEGSWPAACPTESAARYVTTSRGTAQSSSSDHSAPPISLTQARWQLSADLRTHHLMLATGGPVNETGQTQTTTTDCGTGRESQTTEPSTREVGMAITLDLRDLPLPASPQRMSGTSMAPMRLQIGGFEGSIDTRVQWTLRPM
jgi:hypothetical protein